MATVGRPKILASAASTPPLEPLDPGETPQGAPPVPQTNATKNGWKTYPAFKNQGDCVSYVATKGKNKPARS